MGVKISALPGAGSPDGTEVFVLIQGGSPTTKKATVSQLKAILGGLGTAAPLNVGAASGVCGLDGSALVALANLPNLPASIITSGLLPIARGGTNAGDAATMRANFNLAIENLDAHIRSPENITYVLRKRAAYGGTLGRILIGLSAGTCTVTVKINGVAVTGLSSLSVTNVDLAASASGANTFSANDKITVDVSSVAGATDLTFSLEAARA